MGKEGKFEFSVGNGKDGMTVTNTFKKKRVTGTFGENLKSGPLSTARYLGKLGTGLVNVHPVFVTQKAGLDAFTAARSVNGPQPNDSDLCDHDVFEVVMRNRVYDRATEAEKESKKHLIPHVLGLWRNDIKLLVSRDEKWPHIAFCRGTQGVRDVMTDVYDWLSGSRGPIASTYREKLYNWLLDNPDVKVVIGHSLGGHLANAATWNLPNVKTVGVDAARILDITYAYYQETKWWSNWTTIANQMAHTRNIHSDSHFDMALDHYNKAVVEAPRVKDPTKGAGYNAGHNAWRYAYFQRYLDAQREQDKCISTGYGDGLIRAGRKAEEV